jgi:8-oxo-dGTP pyrophosphatase MutT (NUDIX family)
MRGGEGGLELLLLRRSSKLVFFGGAWVFPGGRIDDSDGPGEALEQRARRAAVRELQEEAGLALDPGDLIHFAQWITPPGQTRRFDTWYFAACASEGTVRTDPREVDDHRWMTPADALLARAEGRIELPPPTFVTLAELSAHREPRAAYHALARRPVSRYAPKPCPVPGGMIYLYEEDAGFASRDPGVAGARHRLHALESGWRYERPD